MNGVLAVIDMLGNTITHLERRVAELEAELRRRDEAPQTEPSPTATL